MYYQTVQGQLQFAPNEGVMADVWWIYVETPSRSVPPDRTSIRALILWDADGFNFTFYRVTQASDGSFADYFTDDFALSGYKAVLAELPQQMQITLISSVDALALVALWSA